MAFPQWGSWLLVAQNGSELKICVLSRINSIIYFKNLWAHLSTILFLPPIFFQQKNAVLKATGRNRTSRFCHTWLPVVPHKQSNTSNHATAKAEPINASAAKAEGPSRTTYLTRGTTHLRRIKPFSTCANCRRKRGRNEFYSGNRNNYAA